jgi:hypothetical protein
MLLLSGFRLQDFCLVWMATPDRQRLQVFTLQARLEAYNLSDVCMLRQFVVAMVCRWLTGEFEHLTGNCG